MSTKKTWFITGAGRGMGIEFANAALAAGQNVVATGRNPDAVREALGPADDLLAVKLDVTSTRDAEAAVKAAVDRFGGIDVLVNNAAIPKRRAITALDPAEVEAVMRVNFFAPVRLTLTLLPRMLEQGAGVIVNVSSVGGRLGIIHESAYCASKFALCGWSESMAVDLHGTGVAVKLIEPGPVDTEIWDQPDNDDPIYDGPKFTPEEVADGIIATLDSEQFEHYVPDMKAVVDVKNADIDTYIAGAAAMARP